MWIKVVILILVVSSSGLSFADDNVHLAGALVSEACIIPDNDQSIQVNFDTIQVKTLYQNGQTESIPFTLHLEKCDPAIASAITVSFQGKEDAELSGMLSVDSSSPVRGIAIGILSPDKKLVAINKDSVSDQVRTGNMDISFLAFVEATPSAIEKQSISVGSFSAVATFTLTYQ